MDRIDTVRALTCDLTRAVGVFGSKLAGTEMRLTETAFGKTVASQRRVLLR